MIAPKVDPDKEWGPDHPLRHEAYGCRWLGQKTLDKLRAHKLEEYRRRLDCLGKQSLSSIRIQNASSRITSTSSRCIPFNGAPECH
ncbi:unnamed protein product [Linum tenue]|uniref:Uncharacterized protein n=1 Tax=Linum tenue TaxID=586396 RepID=A0AAV0KRX6_9ROSI|nr:unnamed protein product [Linum tenue]